MSPVMASVLIDRPHQFCQRLLDVGLSHEEPPGCLETIPESRFCSFGEMRWARHASSLTAGIIGSHLRPCWGRRVQSREVRGERRDDFNAEHAEHAEIFPGECSASSAISALSPSRRPPPPLRAHAGAPAKPGITSRAARRPSSARPPRYRTASRRLPIRRWRSTCADRP